MANYLLVYHGGASMENTTPEERTKSMEAWMGWFGSLGDAIVDGGNPVGRAWTLTRDGTIEGGGANPAAGYSVLKAENMDAAVAMARACPILGEGGSIELCETFNVG